MTVIEAKEIRKKYLMGSQTVNALDGLDVEIHKGDFVSIMGPSGSGKSTLMNILGCLDKPTSGEYRLSGVDVTSFSRNELAQIRNEKIGFVFQGFNLLPKYTAMENVEIPMMYKGIPKEERDLYSQQALDKVGLSHRYYHFPSEMSGGEQQRVAIARALISEPEMILADEPTGNLDSKTGQDILELLKKLNQQGVTIILITHDRKIAENADTIIELVDGKVHNTIQLKKRLTNEGN